MYETYDLIGGKPDYTAHLHVSWSLWLHIFSMLWQVDVTHLWTLVAAFLVSFSFVFKSGISAIFDSVVFMFVVHPYDVGDGILINGDLYKVGCRSIIMLAS